MTLTSTQLIQHIETLLKICKTTLNSEDVIRLQQQQFQFVHVDANELILTEISRTLSQHIDDDSVLSFFRMLLRYALIENRQTLNGYLQGKTVELLGVSA
ncbi:hypothetical protein WG68_08620 [Arsukibacterium ikkense]|uniref:Uncharacterized protein n=1 Tax=Arsukibacterium ikkense TaxID=336831 RepID=A0A0M2V5V3_9GAMM|nr:hypothetical protein [Arsukibacterium ikkense]KKO45769.1 hypothetical protein WG68_08620 [Arsukibacterium ikkense]